MRYQSHQSQLIYCAIAGYGQTGPYKDGAGHDINYLAISGVANTRSCRQRSTTTWAFRLPTWPEAITLCGHPRCGHQTPGNRRGALRHQHDRCRLRPECQRVLLPWQADSLRSGGMLNGGTFYDYQTRWPLVVCWEPGAAVLFALCDTLELGTEKLCPESEARTSAGAESRYKQKIAERFLAEAEVFADVDACVEPVLTIEEAAEHPQLKAGDGC